MTTPLPAPPVRTSNGMGKSGQPSSHRTPPAPSASIRAVPAHHSGKRRGSCRSFHTAVAGARQRARSAKAGTQAPAGADVRTAPTLSR
jgi:hypothetical protein